MAAHLIVLWYSQDSNITPPVCLAAYAAAGIAQADPIKTGLYSWALAKGLYLIPLLFVYTSILTGGLFTSLAIGLLAVLGLFSLTLALEGFMLRPLGAVNRCLFLLVTVGCFWPNFFLNLAGALLMIVLIVHHTVIFKFRQGVVEH
jgi:TRAP-type uncharacterized transport system fused permease subunit